MKWFLKTPALFALLASWALGTAAHAQLNTETYYAELTSNNRKDVSVGNPYAPYGNRTDVDRFGDDGSAAIVDASGSVIWRTDQGVYRLLANTQAAKPLFVSKTECIVWTNAFESDPAKRVNIGLTYFRLDSQSGQLVEKQVVVDGNKVLDTPIITTTTNPYTLVTANVIGLPASTNRDTQKNIYIYRLTFDSDAPQLLSSSLYSFIRLIDMGTGVISISPIEFLESAESIAVSADGSQVISLADNILNGNWEYSTIFLWIRNDGSVRQFIAQDDAFVGNVWDPDEFQNGAFVGTPAPAIVPVKLSSSQFVFGGDIAADLYQYTWPTNGDPSEAAAIVLNPPGTVLPLQNFTQKGFQTIFASQAGNDLSLFRLEGGNATLLYTATLPSPMGSDLAAACLNVNPGFESLAICDLSNQGTIWLHQGPGWDQIAGAGAVNYTRLNELFAKPLFVTPGEVVLWSNAGNVLLPDGSLPPVEVNHYGRDAGTGIITKTPVQVLSDATEPLAVYPGALRGTQVFTPYPFTPDPQYWKLETGEKTSSTTLRLRSYQLLTPSNTDEDGDGIRGAMEEGPFYVVPGTFTYAQALEDARRRGGHLATISSAEEYARMQAAITLQTRMSTPLNTAPFTVPYPLWIGLEGTGASAPYTWQWLDGGTSYIADQWAPGSPSPVNGRNRGRLTTTQKWESVNSALSNGYLLELTPTDPLANDTDGDGGSDYDELFRLLTDPSQANFSTPPGTPTPVAFTSSLVYGKYEGFLTQFTRGPISSFVLNVTSSGGFSGKITGYSGNASVRGSFTDNGEVISLPVLMDSGLSTTLNMWISPDPVSGSYRVSGNMVGLNGLALVFDLRRPIYSKSMPTADAGSYTIAIPADVALREGQPAGDGYLVGTIATDGKAKFRGYTSDGQPLSWSGNILEGNLMSFYSAFSKAGGFVGSNLFLRDSATVDSVYRLVGEADIDGDLLVVRKAVFSGSNQMAGYSFRSGAYGSRYQPVSYAQLPSFSEFIAQPSNAVVRFVDGAFSGQDVIATWTPNNVITIPKTQTRTLDAKVNSKTGELRGRYKYNDPVFAYANSTGIFGGVVLQKSGEVRGYYTAGTNSGQTLVIPNSGGTPAPVTRLSPRSKTDISENGVNYKIYLTTSEPWAVINPGSSWVVVQPTSGTGNAELIVSVAANSEGLRREVDLVIAGITHHIEQKHNPYATGGVKSLSPSVKVISSGGGSYSVTINGYFRLNETDFSSPVDWVTITEPSLTSATVVVEMWSWSDSGLTARSAVVTIAGMSHTVIQNPY